MRHCLNAALLSVILLTGCATAPAPVKASLTPLTIVRDVVDAPLVSLTNVFEYFADHTRIARAPGAGVGWSWNSGFDFGIGYDISHFLWKGCSWLFGGVDYLICRSLYPNYPNGISPWRAEGQTWGSLYWPNTKALWAEPEAEADSAAPQPRTSP